MYKYILFSVLCVDLLGSTAFAGREYDELTKNLPQDVIDFVDRRIGCNHWESELPGGMKNPDNVKSGRSQVAKKYFDEAKCEKLASDEKKLREKYAKKKNVLETLERSKDLTPAD